MAIKKKIVMIGDSCVGKTSMIRRFVFNHFKDSYRTTIGSKIMRKELNVHRPNRTENLTFVIWDLIGRKGYHALHARTFVGVHGAICVSDQTKMETLVSLEDYWVPSLFNVVEHVPLVFVCNKSDLKGEVEFEYEDLVNVAREYNGNFDEFLPTGLKSSYTTSAKDGSNVERAFESLGHLVLSSEELHNPVKELYESLVAIGISRSKEKTTPLGALDALIVDFCEEFEDSRLAMLILRQEIERAEININNPTKAGILNFVEYLAEAEIEFLDEKTVHSNLEKRLSWAKRIVDRGYLYYTENAFETLRPSI